MSTLSTLCTLDKFENSTLSAKMEQKFCVHKRKRGKCIAYILDSTIVLSMRSPRFFLSFENILAILHGQQLRLRNRHNKNLFYQIEFRSVSSSVRPMTWCCFFTIDHLPLMTEFRRPQRGLSKSHTGPLSVTAFLETRLF